MTSRSATVGLGRGRMCLRACPSRARGIPCERPLVPVPKISGNGSDRVFGVPAPWVFPLRNAFSVPASSVRDLSRQWVELLAHYRRHRNDEHLDALVEEALRYTGLHLENDLSGSPYWSK